MTQRASGEELRLFVAIELPEAWKLALATLQDDMREAISHEPSLAGVRVRWVQPEGIHLTLKFLGGVPFERVEAIERALASAVPIAPDIELSLARAGSFSDRRAPRVILATIDVSGGARRLHRLFESIETWLAAAGFARERRSFAPHLTLARLPQELAETSRVKVAEITTAVRVPAPEPFTVSQVNLMRSHLGPGGASYECLARLPSSM